MKDLIQKLDTCVHSIKLISAIKRSSHALAINMGIIVLMLAAFILLLPLSVQAGDLFDSQIRLAKYGDAEAQYKVGEMYELGIGVDKNSNEAIYWMTRAANQKHETASLKLLYWDIEKKGLTGRNKAKMEQLYFKAKQGNPQAQYFLGKFYAHGVGVNRNTEIAVEWLKKAALAGVLEAELELVSIVEGKQGETQKPSTFDSDPCNDKTARFLSTC
jgi:TPR repeat protein